MHEYRQTVAMDPTAEILALMESGSPENAILGLETLLASGRFTADELDLFILLCDEQQQPGRAGDMVRRILFESSHDLGHTVKLHGLAELVVRGAAGSEVTDAGDLIQRLVDTALMAEPPDWTELTRTDVGEIVRNAVVASDRRFELASALIFTPDELGFRELAAQTVERLGRDPEASVEFRREAERLLHAAHYPEMAYRVERTGKRQSSPASLPSPDAAPEPNLDGAIIALAGGHAAFRSMVGVAISDAGGELVGIPPRFEAVRRERDILAAIQRAELVLILTSQISHSTSDLVVRAARRLNVPITHVNGASVGTVMQAVRAWQSAVGGPC